MRALREAERAPPRSACAPSTSAPRSSPRPSCAASPTTEHRPALVVTRPDAPKGRGRKLAAAAGRRHRPRARHRRASSPSASTSPRPSSRSPRPGAEAHPAVRVRRAHQGAAAQPLRADPQRPPVAAAALARRGAGRAGDHGRRRRDRRDDHGADRGPRRRAGLRGRARADPPRRHVRDARPRGSSRSAPTCSSTRSTSSPSSSRQPEDGVTYAEKIGRRRPHARPDDAPAAELERTVRALTPHIGARIALPDGTLLGVRAATRAHGRARARRVRDRRRPPRRRHRRRRARAARGPAARRPADARRGLPARARAVKAGGDLQAPDKPLFPDGITKLDLAALLRPGRAGHGPARRTGARSTSSATPTASRARELFTQQAPKHFPDWIAPRDRPEAGRHGRPRRRREARDARLPRRPGGDHAARVDEPPRPARPPRPADPRPRPVGRRLRRGPRAPRKQAGDLYRECGLEPFAMVTGSRGIHVVAPLQAHDRARRRSRGRQGRSPPCSPSATPTS